MKTSFYTPHELKKLGLKAYGKNILISRKTSIYSAENVTIGNNVRIDDFCILSGKIEIGSYVHISAFCVLYGRHRIVINDFCGLSAKVIIYSATDDFSGEFLVGSMIPDKFRNLIQGTVVLNKFVQVGAGSIILPNITLGEGTVVGAMSLVNKSLDAWTINVGIPAKFLKKRKRNILELEQRLRKVYGIKK